MTDSVGSSAGGIGVLQGEIRFPGIIGVDRRITLTLVAQSYATARSSEVTNGDRIRYLIKGLPDGLYAVGAAIDLDGDELLDEEDWAGFAGGTLSAPALRRGNASFVPVVAGEGTANIELGVIGACLLPLGETCVSDSDCRYMTCDCPADAGSGTAAKQVFYLPTCPNASHSCSLPSTQTCTLACAPAPGPQLATGPCLRDLNLTTAESD